MIRLLVMDIDATITSQDGNVSNEVVRTINQAYSKVDYFVLASARPPQGVDTIVKLLNGEFYRVCYLGAVIQDPSQNEIQRLSLDMDVASDIARFADTNKLSLTVIVNDTEYHTQNQSRPSMIPKVSVDCAEGVLALGIPPVLIGTVGHSSSLLVSEYCLKHHAQSAYVVRHFTLDGTLISALVVHPQAQKGRAVTTLCKLLSIDSQEVMAIGDSESDISMFQVAGLSVAVNNASPDVRNAANFVAPLPYGEGVIWALDHLL